MKTIKDLTGEKFGEWEVIKLDSISDIGSIYWECRCSICDNIVPVQSGHIFKLKRSTEYQSLLYNGIDRIDSRYGYTLDNCVPCCFQCNRSKNSLTEKQFWIG